MNPYEQHNPKIPCDIILAFRNDAKQNEEVSEEIILKRIGPSHYICATTCINKKLETSIVTQYDSHKSYTLAVNTLKNTPVFGLLQSSPLYKH